jgi:hypothetical protein
MMSSLQRLFNKYSLLKENNKIVSDVRAEEVMVFKKVYTETDLYFIMSVIIEKVELRLLTEELYTETTVTVNIVNRL